MGPAVYNELTEPGQKALKIFSLVIELARQNSYAVRVFEVLHRIQNGQHNDRRKVGHPQPSCVRVQPVSLL